jgi:hypothetical protein
MSRIGVSMIMRVIVWMITLVVVLVMVGVMMSGLMRMVVVVIMVMVMFMSITRLVLVTMPMVVLMLVDAMARVLMGLRMSTRMQGFMQLVINHLKRNRIDDRKNA